MSALPDLPPDDFRRVEAARAVFESTILAIKPEDWVPSKGRQPCTVEQQERIANHIVDAIEQHFKVTAPVYLSRSSSVQELRRVKTEIVEHHLRLAGEAWKSVGTWYQVHRTKQFYNLLDGAPVVTESCETINISALTKDRLSRLADELERGVLDRLASAASAVNGPRTSRKDPLKWKDVDIRFTSEFQVQITTPDDALVMNYADLGFEDRRGGGGKPNLAWRTFRRLAECGGTLADASTWTATEKRVQEIRRKLRDRIDIPGDPIPFVPGAGYRAAFKISCAAAYQP